MRTLLILSIVQAAFLSALLFSKKDKTLSTMWLAAWLLLMMVNQFYFLAIYFYPKALPLEGLLMLSAFPLLSGPVFFLYVASLTKATVRVKWLHFMPFLIFPAFIILIKSDVTIDNGFLISKSDSYQPFYHYYGYLFAALPLIYISWSYKLLGSYRKRIHDKFSNLAEINLRWLKTWLQSALIFFVISFPCIYFATNLELFDKSISFKLIAIFNTVYIFIVGYFGFKQTTIFSDIQIEKEAIKKPEKYTNSGLTEELADVYRRRLKVLMEKERLYLEANLNAKYLSIRIGISTNTLSQLLNQYEGKTFYQYINDLRIEAVIGLMKDSLNDNISMEGLAYESGFNSRSTFVKAFKSKMGISPSEFRGSLT
ncbi:MAG: AraC-like DNA-binding protein [Arcticibacterium sp.]|jgi:AraC-like DNA-binding protein